MTTFTTEDRISATGRGIGTDVDMSHAEIAKEMGVTKTRVQQIEATALQKLKKRLLWGHNIEKLGDIA